jgi:hypothetical protein
MRVVQKDLSPYKEEFIKNGCVRLPSFLNPIIIELLKKGFSENIEKRDLLDGDSTEYTICQSMTVLKLDVAFNDPEYLTCMSEFIGRPIKSAKHRLSYIDPTCVSLPWHDDSYSKDTRIAAIRFELSDGPYEGGDFLFRSDAGEFRFNNLQFGEAVIFKIEHRKADHMVTQVTSGVRKSLSMFLCE